MNLNLFLEVLALVFLVLAGVKTPEPTKLSYGWMGLAIIDLVLVLGGVKI